MEILEESRMMLELAINSLQRAGHDTEQFERTVVRIKQVKKLNIDNVSNQRELLICGNCKEFEENCIKNKRCISCSKQL